MTESFYFKSDKKDNHYESKKSVMANLKSLTLPCDELLYEYDNKKFVTAISSIYRAAEIANSPINVEKTGNKGRSSMEIDHGGSWHGTESMDETNELVSKGWKAGLDKMHKITEQIESFVGSKMRIEIPEYDVSGEEVDPVAFATGELEHMVTYDTEESDKQGKIVTIALNPTISAGVSVNQITNRGACVLAIIDLLKKSGYETRLVIVSSFSCYGSAVRGHVFYIHAQDPGQYIDEDIISFVTANPSFFRRIIFSLCEHLEKDHVGNTYYSGGGYGTVGKIKGLVDADIIFDGMPLNEYQGVEDCSDKVIAMLKACPNVDIKFSDEEGE